MKFCAKVLGRFFKQETNENDSTRGRRPADTVGHLGQPRLVASFAGCVELDVRPNEASWCHFRLDVPVPAAFLASMKARTSAGRRPVELPSHVSRQFDKATDDARAKELGQCGVAREGSQRR